jgi:hypothetical protein
MESEINENRHGSCKIDPVNYLLLSWKRETLNGYVKNNYTSTLKS